MSVSAVTVFLWCFVKIKRLFSCLFWTQQPWKVITVHPRLKLRRLISCKFWRKKPRGLEECEEVISQLNQSQNVGVFITWVQPGNRSSPVSRRSRSVTFWEGHAPVGLWDAGPTPTAQRDERLASFGGIPHQFILGFSVMQTVLRSRLISTNSQSPHDSSSSGCSAWAQRAFAN